MKNSAKRWILPVLLFILALIPRFYRLSEIYLFNADEEYQATYARTISEDFHVVWIGVSAGNTGFYLGPYWTYLTALLLKLSAGDPLLTGYFAAVLGAATTVLIYLLGKELVGRRASYLAGVFYALSPLAIYSDQKYWNPSSLPLLSLLLIFSSALIVKSPWFLYLFSICLGLIFHVHLSLVPLALVLLAFLAPTLVRAPKRRLFTALILFLLTISPLIAFDYFHDFSNITTPLRWHEIRSGLDGTPGEHFGTALAMLGRLWYLSPGFSSDNEVRPYCLPEASTIPSAFLAVIAFLPITLFALRRSTWVSPRKQLILFGYLAITIPFLLYPGKNFEYYLLGTIPLYFLIVGNLFSHLPRLVLAIPLALLVFTTTRTLVENDARWGLAAKRVLIQESMAAIGDAPYDLTESGQICHRYGGWRYLYTVYGRYPERSSIDNSFGWLYPEEITSTPTEYLLKLNSTSSSYSFSIKHKLP